MDYNEIAVILKQSGTDSSYESSLKNKGFSNILSQNSNAPSKEDLRNVLENKESRFFIFVDESDGFSASDVATVADALGTKQNAVYVGTRSQECKQSFQEKIFLFLSGIEAQDIHSSLIGISRAFAEDVLEMKSSGKAFRLDILLEARIKNMTIENIPVSAVCEKPAGWELLASTFKLYQVFIKFSIAAAIAYVVDIGTFLLFQITFSYLADEYKILVATVLSRILCSVTTYILNRGAVFKSTAQTSGTVVRYIILAVGQLLVSWLLVWGLGYVFGNSDLVHTILKIIVDLVIFIASFTLQRDWVFKESKGLLK